jgi:hypothetical protein
MHGKLNSLLSDGFVEALWETIIALATAAGYASALSAWRLISMKSARRVRRSDCPLPPVPRRPVSPISVARRRPQTSTEFNLHGGDRIVAAPKRRYGNEED